MNNEFREDPTVSSGNVKENGEVSTPEKIEKGTLSRWMEALLQMGLGESMLRVGTSVLSLVIILVVVWLVRVFYNQTPDAQVNAVAAQGSTPTPAVAMEEVASVLAEVDYEGIPRMAQPFTTIPSRPRQEITKYTVQDGDTIFGISEKFGLDPETILWGNYAILQDNPHALQPGQELNILPVNGTYHEWRDGESLTKVADYYGVDPLDIVQYPGNHIDIYDFDLDNPSFETGQMLIVPGGTRELVDYGPPAITRDNPAIAATYGPGHCGAIYTGSVGVGVFIWPTTERWISGYDYSPATNHPAIDIAGQIGNPVWSADNGVVVYSGWSNYGYGNLVVIDHGNGWQTLYAHLNSINVGCGQSVNQGEAIGALGSTGNSSGAHLHFELIYNGSKVNPWNFLQ